MKTSLVDKTPVAMVNTGNVKLVPPGGLRYEHDKRSAWKSRCPLKFDMIENAQVSQPNDEASQIGRTGLKEKWRISNRKRRYYVPFDFIILANNSLIRSCV